MARTLVILPKFASEADEADRRNSTAGARYSEQIIDRALEACAFVKGSVTAQSLAFFDETASKMRLKAPMTVR